jgi:general secretion pathway protein B
LPEFNISGHAYSPEPQTRVARINEKILQEGQELAPGLKLEEITPGGVIFGYRGYRFRVELSGNR